VTTEHNGWSSFAWPTRALNALTWHLDDVHVAVSEEVGSSIRPRRAAAGTEVLVHGIDRRALVRARARREEVRGQLGVPPDHVLVGTVANYRAQKAYPDLLAAARTVLDRCPEARFVAVGQGPQRAEVHELHDRLRLDDRFTLLGYRADPEVVLAACDVFVLASHFEGYPIALMEALGIGLPVVATSVGGVVDAVRDGVEGLLVPPGRPAALAEALGTLVGDEALRARCAAAALERGERYDIVGAVRRTESIYLQLAGGGARHP
jgi:glycosyltransferase involved in cell wall biosynthesis